jgi:hypothetical protein
MSRVASLARQVAFTSHNLVLLIGWIAPFFHEDPAIELWRHPLEVPLVRIRDPSVMSESKKCRKTR